MSKKIFISDVEREQCENEIFTLPSRGVNMVHISDVERVCYKSRLLYHRAEELIKINIAWLCHATVRAKRVLLIPRGSPRGTFIKLISFYQRSEPLRKSFFQAVGIQQSYVCVFYPSCSSYCKTSFEKYGIFKGFFKCVWRISRCHPWQKKHIDQV